MAMNFPHQRWRLLITPPARGAWNMALDEALLEAVGQGQSLPCLRLYAWEPPCLSIGYAQASDDLDQNRLVELGWDWVRRLTGGRAILHTDELTYSVIAPIGEPRVAGSVLESYRRLATALLAALHSLQIPAATHPLKMAGDAQENGPVCFEVPSNYEIIVSEKKLVGSAQARRKEGVLQHGTLPLWGDLTRITQGLHFSDEDTRQEAGKRLLVHATTVETVLGRKIDWQEAAQAFVEAFQHELNLDLIRGELTQDELSRAEQLVGEKYSHPSWTNRI
jgi:lipoate-protein ligase A